MEIAIKIENRAKKYSVFINTNKEIILKGKCAIVTNKTISKLWLDDIKQRVECGSVVVIEVENGEEYKNFETLNFILEKMFEVRLDRASAVVAFGGGVVSDMAGFAASIYQRGIDFITVPTTLLSQIDASVGGKTGINNKFGKNLIGSFYQPRAVYCDYKYLKTLSKREFNAGVAEAIKVAVMFDRELFAFMQEHELKSEDEIAFLVQRCVSIKAEIVRLDEKENGIRAALNYGHTFAHVIENKTNYKKYLHGEAVAIGIVMANELAESLGLISRYEKEQIRELLTKFELPTQFKIEDEESFYEAFFLDKKSKNSKIKFILPDGIGAFRMVDNLKKELVLEVLRRFL